MFPFLAQFRKKFTETRSGSQGGQMHICLKEGVIRKSIISGVLDPFLSFVEFSKCRVYGPDAICRVMKVEEILSYANRLGHIGFGSFAVAAFGSQHRASSVEHSALIDRIVFKLCIQKTSGFIQTA